MDITAPVLTAHSARSEPFIVVGRWYRKVRRRRGGVYLWRVDHHLHRSRRHVGYVGETNSYYFREKDQLGKGRAGGMAPWSDLNPKRYKVIPLPWWLCWKPILRSLETVVILLTWPVYNDAKNRWNPRRISKIQARMDRARRDSGFGPSRTRIMMAHAVRLVFMIGSMAIIALTAYAIIHTHAHVG